LFAFNVLTLRELMDPLRNVSRLPVMVLTSIVLNDPNCEAMYGDVRELTTVIELNRPVPLTMEFAISPLFVIVLIEARFAPIKLIDNELNKSELTDAFVAINVAAVTVLLIVRVLNVPADAIYVFATNELTTKLLTEAVVAITCPALIVLFTVNVLKIPPVAT